MRLKSPTQEMPLSDWQPGWHRTVMRGVNSWKSVIEKIPLRGFFYESSPEKTYSGLLSPKPRALDGEGTRCFDRCPTIRTPCWEGNPEAYADYLRGISQLIELYGIPPRRIRGG